MERPWIDGMVSGTRHPSRQSLLQLGYITLYRVLMQDCQRGLRQFPSEVFLETM